MHVGSLDHTYIIIIMLELLEVLDVLLWEYLADYSCKKARETETQILGMKYNFRNLFTVSKTKPWSAPFLKYSKALLWSTGTLWPSRYILPWKNIGNI